MASTVQRVPAGDVAVKSPAALIVPHFAIHLTGKLALNCCVSPCGVFAVAGVITMGDTNWTLAVENAAEPSVAVAVTLQVPGWRGATNNPPAEIDPQVVAHLAL